MRPQAAARAHRALQERDEAGRTCTAKVGKESFAPAHQIETESAPMASMTGAWAAEESDACSVMS